MYFRNRAAAALELAEKLKSCDLHQPVVLAIPWGGVVVGAVVARELNAELDVVLCRRLRSPGHPELTLGAISEDGQVYLNPLVQPVSGAAEDYMAEEQRRQMAAIARGKKLFRDVHHRVPITGRSVIVTDDGIASGSTMMAVLQVVKAQNPRELIVAVPVAPPARLDKVRQMCDQAICLHNPDEFWTIGDFYQDFPRIEDQQVIELLQESAVAAHRPA
jgi:putative phosphoribosyl transferase